jgi:predicted ATPase
VLVLDDVHWADDATLDVLRYIGRRVGELAAVSRSASPIHRRRLEGPANESHRGYPCAAAPASAVRATNRNRSPR